MSHRPWPVPSSTGAAAPARPGGARPRATMPRTPLRSARARRPAGPCRRPRGGCTPAGSAIGRQPARSPTAGAPCGPGHVGSGGRRPGRPVGGRRTPGRPGRYDGRSRPRSGPGRTRETRSVPFPAVEARPQPTPWPTPPSKGSRSSKSPSRFSALAVKDSTISLGWNIPACQVAMWSSESAVEWSRV